MNKIDHADSGGFDANLASRQTRGRYWKAVFMASTIVAIAFLLALVASIVNDSFGYVVMGFENDPRALARDGTAVDDQDAAALLMTLDDNLAARRVRAIERESPLAGRSRDELLALVYSELLKPDIKASYGFAESVFGKKAVLEAASRDWPEGRVVFRSWVNLTLLGASQSSEPLLAGIRGAIVGTLMTILITILFAFPVGIAAAIWLEEYARDNPLNRFIRVNIYNLAGVPSIIYGMLGLAIFVRGLEPITSGAAFGVAMDREVANGRTILSAGLTLALLILPVIIINAQEALKAIPNTLRYSSYAVGATKWQTILHHVLPASFDRILTGTVLAISRAIGETAPLVVIGASTFLSQDPTSVFSKFTTLPIQIYQWTARPQPEFRNLAAAAILVLLALMLSLNGFAIYFRDRLRKNKRPGA